MGEYIEREAFLEQKRKQYCEDCTRRKGMKNGKYKTLYEIGEAPCRACGIDDVLNDVEDFPAADVRPVKRGKWISVNDGETIVRMTYGEPQESCRCSVCGEWLVGSDEYAVKGNFCPNCGAWMGES